MKRKCHGNNDFHCCWFKGIECPFVEENTIEGRRWSCSLLRELGDWDKVLKDKRYKKEVQPLYDLVPELEGMNCRDWPQNYPEVMKQLSGKCCWDD